MTNKIIQMLEAEQMNKEIPTFAPAIYTSLVKSLSAVTSGIGFPESKPLIRSVAALRVYRPDQ
jgi:hypothetical protein